MPILLMNLLIGLAVGDIASVRRNAQLKRLAMQVVMHTELEKKLPRFWLDKINKPEVIEYPNEVKCKLGFADTVLPKWLSNPFRETSDGGALIHVINFYVNFNSVADGLDEVFDEHEDYDSLEKKKQKRKLNEMAKAIQQQHQLLRLIVQVN